MPKPACCESAGHRSQEVERVNAEQSVKEVGCELEEAWQDWKGNRGLKESSLLFFKGNMKSRALVVIVVLMIETRSCL